MTNDDVSLFDNAGVSQPEPRMFDLRQFGNIVGSTLIADYGVLWFSSGDKLLVSREAYRALFTGIAKSLSRGITL